jgi:hypothetical protein
MSIPHGAQMLTSERQSGDGYYSLPVLFVCWFAVFVGEKNRAGEDDQRGNQQDGDAASQSALRFRPRLSSIGFAGGAALRIGEGAAGKEHDE